MTTSRPSSGRLWPYAIVGLLAMNAGIVGITVYVASNDRSFAVVPAYYEKASRWDQEMAARRKEAALGWSLSFNIGAPDLKTGSRLLAASMTDCDGQPLEEASLSVEAFHNASARERVILDLTPSGRPGEFAATLPNARPGLWTFQFAARRSGDTWSHMEDVEIRGGTQ